MNFSKKYDWIVFVGRFQPFHSGHKFIIDEALKHSDKVLVAIGSYRSPTDFKNPWTFEERKSMIRSGMNLSKSQRERLHMIPIRDYTYSDTTWITALQSKVSAVTGDSKSVGLIGHFKDDSSVYLTFFPQWPLLKQPNFKGINGTDIRNAFFSNEYEDHKKLKEWMLPGGQLDYGATWGMSQWLKNWKANNEGRFSELLKEKEFLKDYNAQWTNTPFPVNFVTSDAIVTQSGHVLMVRRRINPGRGKFALPGGFVNVKETIFDGCIRELYEETNIDIPKEIMKKAVQSSQVFDHPRRSGRGRIITHGYHFQLSPGGPLPVVQGGDDAYGAQWISFNDLALYEQEMFSDHIHIINHFVNVGR